MFTSVNYLLRERQATSEYVRASSNLWLPAFVHVTKKSSDENSTQLDGHKKPPRGTIQVIIIPE